MKPKPAHLAPRYAAQFDDDTVARSYHTRPPYPAEVFDVLKRLAPSAPRRVLDLGCGTGDVALALSSWADRIDAVDASPAMIRVARARVGGGHPGVTWTCAPVEAFPFDEPYALVVAAESLHWMDWEVVLPRIGRALLPRAFLALVIGRSLPSVPWSAALGPIITRYSTNREYEPYDLVVELTSRDLFREAGRCTTAPVSYRQSVDDYVESFHTRNGLSRRRMSADAAAEFDAALRRLVSPHCPDGVVQGAVQARVVWGAPAPA